MSFESEINEFFKNQTVFLTGATGFLGKVILEKLLRSCEDVSKIYVLIRPKKNRSSDDRFKQLFDQQCFDPLKSTKTEVFQNVCLVYGDCEKPNLGLSNDDLKNLKLETTCIIHAAASVKFDQSLKQGACLVRATRDLIEIAKDMKNLKSFVYISTAYSNCIHSTIKEQFYEPPIKPEAFISFVEALDENVLEEITPKLLGKYPNTYIFVKCIAEDLVKSATATLPISLFRPAIIHSAVKEPLVGWLDNLYGPTGIVIGFSVGILRSVWADSNSHANMVPVDYVSNAILAAAANYNPKRQIYNFVGSKSNSVTWGDFVQFTMHLYEEYPLEKAVWYLSFNLNNNYYWHRTCQIFLENMPAYVIDFGLIVFGKKAMAVKLYEKIHKVIAMTSYFTLVDWNFEDDNVQELWKNMSESDQKTFYFDMSKLDWVSYLQSYIKYGRLFVLKEKPETIPRARVRQKILMIIHYIVISLFWILVYFLFKFIYKLFI